MLSHFKPLVAVLRVVADDVAVVTHCAGRRGEIEALGVRVIEFDFGRWSNNPVREAFAGTSRCESGAWRKRRRCCRTVAGAWPCVYVSCRSGSAGKERD